MTVLLALRWLAAQAPVGDPGIIGWIQYGVLGLVVVGFIMGWIVPGPIHKREIERGDRMERLAIGSTDLAQRGAGSVQDLLEHQTRLERLEAELRVRAPVRKPKRST